MITKIMMVLLFFGNLCTGYPGANGRVTKSISRRFWILWLIVEFLLITALAVWDLTVSHYDSWVIPFIVYLVMYVMALLVWFVYKQNTVLAPGQKYTFYLKYKDEQYYYGHVWARKKKIFVVLPKKDVPDGTPDKISVRFKEVDEGDIIVTPV